MLKFMPSPNGKLTVTSPPCKQQRRWINGSVGSGQRNPTAVHQDPRRHRRFRRWRATRTRTRPSWTTTKKCRRHSQCPIWTEPASDTIGTSSWPRQQRPSQVGARRKPPSEFGGSVLGGLLATELGRLTRRSLAPGGHLLSAQCAPGPGWTAALPRLGECLRSQI